MEIGPGGYANLHVSTFRMATLFLEEFASKAKLGTVFLNHEIDILTPGTYTVQVRYKDKASLFLPPNGVKKTIKSNLLTFRFE